MFLQSFNDCNDLKQIKSANSNGCNLFAAHGKKTAFASVEDYGCWLQFDCSCSASWKKETACENKLLQFYYQ